MILVMYLSFFSRAICIYEYLCNFFSPNLSIWCRDSTPFFVSVSMDGHADIPPSYSGLSQYPRANPFGDESSNRATMPPPSGSSLPPFPLRLRIPPTGQPFQFGSQNFIPGSSPSQSMLSQVPHTMLDSSSIGSGSSQPSSVFSGLFNADQLSKIAASNELKEMAESDPKHLKMYSIDLLYIA